MPSASETYADALAVLNAELRVALTDERCARLSDSADELRLYTRRAEGLTLAIGTLERAQQERRDDREEATQC